MNILLLGDSWAWPTNNDGYLNIENSFLQAGHMVHNKSMFGCSNSWTLNTSKYFALYSKHIVNIDLVIWFHTDLLRDHGSIDFNKVTTYKDALDKLHYKNYELVLDIKQTLPNAKWTIIGGNSQVYRPEDYSWVDLLIVDWKSELVGQTLPDCQCLSEIEWMSKQKNIFGIDTLEDEAKKWEIIINAMKDRSDIFHDGVHPANFYNQALVKRIINHFNIN